MKLCSVCKQTKDLGAFYSRLDRFQQFQSECKECCRIRRAKWWKSESGKLSSRNSKLKARFGITLQQYNQLLENQNFKCLICTATESVLGHSLAVDHCHTTGKIRGLLCKSCNIGIGNLKDNIQNLQNAIKYLKNFNISNSENFAPVDL